MKLWNQLGCLFFALFYLWLYPSILLVPDEYRQGFWSVQDNIVRGGLVLNKEVCEVRSLLHEQSIYRVWVMINGEKHCFWVANSVSPQDLLNNELSFFETRGKVIVLAKSAQQSPVILSRLNY